VAVSGATNIRQNSQVVSDAGHEQVMFTIEAIGKRYRRRCGAATIESIPEGKVETE
jgi:hypothetical protein